MLIPMKQEELPFKERREDSGRIPARGQKGKRVYRKREESLESLRKKIDFLL